GPVSEKAAEAAPTDPASSNPPFALFLWILKPLAVPSAAFHARLTCELETAVAVRLVGAGGGEGGGDALTLKSMPGVSAPATTETLAVAWDSPNTVAVTLYT